MTHKRGKSDVDTEEYQKLDERSKNGPIYVSSEVILYSINDLMKMTGWGYASVSRLFDDPEFPSIDFGRGRMIENHALMNFFSVRREEETRLFQVKLDRDPWDDGIYDDYYFSWLSERYIDRCKKVDDLELDWLDAASIYASPEVVFFTKEEIQERSNWTDEESELLFMDLRFPRTVFARKTIIEVHALIQFFARKDLVKQNQLKERERREAFFAQLRRERSGR